MKWGRIMQWFLPARPSAPDSAKFDAVVNEAVLAGEKTGAAASEVVAAARRHTEEVEAEQARMQRVAADHESRRGRGTTGSIRDLAEAMLLSQIPPEKRKG